MSFLMCSLVSLVMEGELKSTSLSDSFCGVRNGLSSSDDSVGVKIIGLVMCCTLENLVCSAMCVPL